LKLVKREIYARYFIAISGADGKMFNMASLAPIREIACQQVMLDDASVFSVQWIDLPIETTTTFSAHDLLCCYLRYIRKCTLTSIRPVMLENGIEFRLIGSGLSLISFLPPVYEEPFATLRISGGLLVQRYAPEAGELYFGVERKPESLRITLRLSDFRPAILGRMPPSPLRFQFYHLTQAAIHRWLTINFLSRLANELAGSAGGTRIVKVAVRSGKTV
jgi:hypothetical protein